jgi:hypothetical protein
MLGQRTNEVGQPLILHLAGPVQALDVEVTAEVVDRVEVRDPVRE